MGDKKVQTPTQRQTSDEIAYIHTIGSYSNSCRNLGKVELLTRYIRAAELRKNWGAMNKGDVIQAAYTERERYMALGFDKIV